MFKIFPEMRKNRYVKHGYVDYICFFDNRAFGIEAKECAHDKYFYLLKISEKQQEVLDVFSEYANGMIIFYFSHFKKFILIKWDILKSISNHNSIVIKDIIKAGIKVNLKNEKLDLTTTLKTFIKQH